MPSKFFSKAPLESHRLDAVLGNQQIMVGSGKLFSRIVGWPFCSLVQRTVVVVRENQQSFEGTKE